VVPPPSNRGGATRHQEQQITGPNGRFEVKASRTSSCLRSCT
jgi:hypothetical protein